MDKLFRVEIDRDGSSPRPQTACWRGQHQCVSEKFAFDEVVPEESKAGEYTIKHAVNKEHFSVLNPAYLVLYAGWFPHSVLAQITRHQDSSFLVQSMRYTGDRIYKLGEDLLKANTRTWTYWKPDESSRCLEDQFHDLLVELFYFREVGERYTNRQGKKYVYSEESYQRLLYKCMNACVDYYLDISEGMSEEHARDGLPYNFRQHFMIAGRLQDVFHWMDQRSKADSQLEIRQFAELSMQKITEFAPEFGEWYMSKRYSKARLAP